ncbi:hemicentin-1-like isoform X2 [Anabas testudineus]|uniref:hemicentin-1-like isoform X2 n=1 Tax=Anabas testudineus TaxID=64144 RepID=UPI000E4633AB|nr:hemicentin-1-like isoform X2 [Anabas testudineus]
MNFSMIKLNSRISNASLNIVFHVDMEKLITLLLILAPGTVSADWPVTFENPNPCALKGSSVTFRCTYNYTAEETVLNHTWHKGLLKGDIWTRVELSELSSYHSRTEYLGDLHHNCSLAIHDVQDTDAGHYYFKFDTNKYGRRSKGSVYLSVTELSARVHPQRVRAGDTVTLECRTTCQLSSVVWFKDGRPVAEPEFQAKAEDAGNYLCVVEGRESLRSYPVALDVQYPPLNVSIEVSQPGSLALGKNVSLTCSSAANPAADYTWYKGASSSSPLLQVGSGRVLPLLSVEASHTGLYLCRARNSVGENNSTEVLLTLGRTNITVTRVLLFFGLGIKVVIVMLLPLVIIWAWKRRKTAANKKVYSHDYENIHTA